MIPLAKAAYCRAESDWLVGINATRAMTAFNSKAGGFQLTPVGRVQTPTLAILVEREKKIRAFKPRTYFEVHGEFGVKAGNVCRTLDGREFSQVRRRRRARRTGSGSAEKADAIRDKCAGKVGVVTEEKKPASQAAPLLFDLTQPPARRQRPASVFSARRTLQIAQQLYEKFKVLTYPAHRQPVFARGLSGDGQGDDGRFHRSRALAKHADKALASGWVKSDEEGFR